MVRINDEIANTNTPFTLGVEIPANAGRDDGCTVPFFAIVHITHPGGSNVYKARHPINLALPDGAYRAVIDEIIGVACNEDDMFEA